jgi:hypothetical protein
MLIFCKNVTTPALIAVALILSGCGGDSRPTTVPVSGKITWNGEPLKSGTVAFVPTGDKQTYPASGVIDSSGNYKMTTFKTGDGVIPGDYQVSVIVLEGADPATKSEGKRVLPEKYDKAATSGLTTSIKPGEGPKTIDLKLEGKR